MLDSVPKQLTNVPQCTTKPTIIVQSEPMMEVMPDFQM
jgi:hypothetical protein